MNKSELAKYIDHTLLKPEATKQDIENLCKEAAEYGFCCVCVNPNYVLTAKRLLKGTGVKVAAVVGFPLGEHRTEIKVMETVLAVADGADEIDMVMSVSALKNKDYNYVTKDIKAVVDAGKLAVKVILEISRLDNDEIVKACELCVLAGAAMVKTSTGFLGGGATIEAVKLMNKCVAHKGLGVKASGGIRDYNTAIDMINAGAARIGTSCGTKIVEEAK